MYLTYFNGQWSEGNTPLLLATARDEDETAEVIAALLAAGAKANVKNAAGQTTLLGAADRDMGLPVITALVEGGADLNAVNKDDLSALMLLALKGKDAATIVFLVEKGADKTLAESFGDTAALMAAENPALAGHAVLELLK